MSDGFQNTRTVTTTTYPISNAAVTSYRTTYIDPLRTAIQQDKIIYKSHINLLRTAIEVFRNHNHTWEDYAAIKTRENNGPGSVLSNAARPTTAVSLSNYSTPTEIADNTVISHTTINTYVTSVNSFKDHLHLTDDVYGYET